MIEIYHLIYFREGGIKSQYARITYRNNWDFKKNEQKKKMTNQRIPYPFEELLDDQYDKNFLILDIRACFLEFTIGFDKKEDLWAIAIKHPRDNYNKKIGRAMVEGRIKRMKGEIEGREPYDLNEFFLVHKEE